MWIALLGAALIIGQEPRVWDRTCMDDNARDVCAAGMRAELLGRLGMVSVENEAEAGVESYRAFFVDGYGQDMPAMAFERRPGSGPTSVVYGFGGAKLETPISAATWAEIVSQSAFADRQLVEPEQESGTAPPALCLHAWNVAIEMANSPVSRSRTEPVRRRFESACNGALTTRYAFFLAEQTLKAQPHCQALSADMQRNSITALATCLSLRGDRIAAGQVFDAKNYGGPRWGLDVSDAGTWRAWLGTTGSPRLNWNGEVRVTDRGRNNIVAEFIVAKLREWPSLKFNPARYEGLSSKQVRVTGIAEYGVDEGSGGYRMRADYAQIWVWDPNLSDWMVSDWTVGAFARVE